MFISLLACIILVVSTYFVICNPIIFTIIWGVVGCAYDSCGIVMALGKYFPYYRLLMNGLVVLSALLSIIHFLGRKQPSSNAVVFMFCALLFFFGIVMSEIIIFIKESISPVNLMSGPVEFGPLIFIIWLDNYGRFYLKGDPWKLIYIFVCCQIIISTLIIYLPCVNINVLKIFCGENYISDGYVYNRNIFMNVLEVYKIFSNKYLYNGLGQFHNGNDMGFYGVVGIFLSFRFFILSKKNREKIFSIFIIYLSLLMWGNSGMRGPVIGGVAGGILTLILRRNSLSFFLQKKIMLILCVGGGVVFLGGIEFFIKFYSFLIPSLDNVSFVGRLLYRHNAMEYLNTNWLWGAGGLLGHLTIQEIDPHELVLRISCLFGIFTGGFSFLLIYLMPGFLICITPEKKCENIVSYCILFLVSMTNNYTCLALFYLLFSVMICTMVYKTENSFSGVDRSYSKSV